MRPATIGWCRSVAVYGQGARPPAELDFADLNHAPGVLVRITPGSNQRVKEILLPARDHWGRQFSLVPTAGQSDPEGLIRFYQVSPPRGGRSFELNMALDIPRTVELMGTPIRSPEITRDGAVPASALKPRGQRRRPPVGSR